MSYKLRPYVLLIFATCVAGNVFANERWYDVELLVFKHAKAEHFLTEQWPTSWSIPDTNESVDPANIQKTYADRFETLAKNRQSFAGIIDNLEKSSRYEVLAYRSWRQIGLDKNQAVNIRVQGGKTYRKLGAPFSAPGDQVSTSTPSDQPQPETGTLFEPVLDENGSVIRYTIPRYAPAAGDSDAIIHELDGNIKIVLSRFLHVYTDLLLVEPVNLKPERNTVKEDDNLSTETDLVEETQDSFEAMETEVTPAAYRLSPAIGDVEFTTLHGFNIQSHRRMRSGELHHLDHPLIGILVKVTPSSE